MDISGNPQDIIGIHRKSNGFNGKPLEIIWKYEEFHGTSDAIRSKISGNPYVFKGQLVHIGLAVRVGYNPRFKNHDSAWGGVRFGVSYGIRPAYSRPPASEFFQTPFT